MEKEKPEPWKVLRGLNVATQGRLVISIPTGDTLEETRSLAELVAEAPVTAYERDRLKALNAELLAALKAIHDRLKPFRVTYQHQSEKDALRWAEEAIAKAEGRD